MNANKKQDKLSESLFRFRLLEKKKLVLSLSITLLVMILELIGGILINSIALVSDAGHMFTHAFSIIIGLLAISISQKAPCHHKTFGSYRAEVLAAFINGLLLIIVAIVIVYESFLRILNPAEINGFTMLIIAFIGLSANVSSILILRGSQKSSINVKSVFYHMFADAAASIGIVFVAIIIIYNPKWTVLDPIISLVITVLILAWAIGILKDSGRILLEMAPKGYNVDIIEEALKKEFKEIEYVFNPHLWSIIPGMLVFSTHVKVVDGLTKLSEQGDFLEKVNAFLHKNFSIIESTIQISTNNKNSACFFLNNSGKR